MAIEREMHMRVIRGMEQQALIDMKEKAKIEARQRDYVMDKVNVATAIREAEEIKRKEEEKKQQLRAVQSSFVEASKRDKMVKLQEAKVRDQADYERAVLHNTYFQKHDA